MPLRTVLILIVSIAIILFAALNWAAFTTPTTLRLGFTTVEAPLGLIMLGLILLMAFLFLIFVTYLQTSVLLENRRHARELQAQRDVAEQAEASRYSRLREFLEAELQKIRYRSELAETGIIARLDQLDRDLRGVIEQAGNTLAAYIGELEDRLQRERSQGDREKSPS
ncbi:MAG TPA: LapA family protein [Candidatus Eisenbacteria bacterium]|nr:LapA family protein [Candidatus Eisenbacteria bacterium]